MSMTDFMGTKKGKFNRGQGQIAVNPTWKNSTRLKGREALDFAQFLEHQFSFASVRKTYDGPLDNAQLSDCALKSGVYINGYSSPWKTGCACAYVHDEIDKIGVVRNMFCRREESRMLVVFQIAPYSILDNLVPGRKVLFSVASQPVEGDPDLVLWKSVHYKCLLIPNGAVATAMMVNSTRTEEFESA